MQIEWTLSIYSASMQDIVEIYRSTGLHMLPQMYILDVNGWCSFLKVSTIHTME